jgi:hypothetical protein
MVPLKAEPGPGAYKPGRGIVSIYLGHQLLREVLLETPATYHGSGKLKGRPESIPARQNEAAKVSGQSPEHFVRHLPSPHKINTTMRGSVFGLWHSFRGVLPGASRRGGRGGGAGRGWHVRTSGV